MPFHPAGPAEPSMRLAASRAICRRNRSVAAGSRYFLRNLSCIDGNPAIRIAHDFGQRQEHAPAGRNSVRRSASASASIARMASTTSATRQYPREQPFHRGFHAIIGGHSVNHEDGCVSLDTATRIASAWGCVNRSSSRFSSVRCGRQFAIQCLRSCPEPGCRRDTWPRYVLGRGFRSGSGAGSAGVPGRLARGRRPWPARVSRGSSA